MEENIATRLKLFIDTNGLTSSQFADMCRIPRPTLSQILSGRNKKISDTIVKQVHEAFPDLSILWLMFGEGPVKTIGSTPELGGPSIKAGSKLKNEILESDSPGNAQIENSIPLVNPSRTVDNSNLKALNVADIASKSTKNQLFESDLRMIDLQQQIENMRKNPRKVIQITIYYDDSTFETFIPKS